MKYKSWVHRNGAVMVEKYQGAITNIDDVVENDRALIENSNAPSNGLLVLTDLSFATFEEIDREEIGSLFLAIDEYKKKISGMKLALYTGLSHYEDFQFSSSYAEHALSRPITIIPFNFLDTAMSWLGLTENEKTVISGQLMEEM